MQETLLLEKVSEDREVALRAAAKVASCDTRKKGSLFMACSSVFGSRASDLFRSQLNESEMYQSHAAIAGLPAADLPGCVSVSRFGRSDKVRTLTLNDAGLWVCSCNYQFSVGVPCRHILRQLSSSRPLDSFDTLKPYFHERWLINVSLPKYPLGKIADKSSLLSALSASATSSKMKDVADKFEEGCDDGASDAYEGVDGDHAGESRDLGACSQESLVIGLILFYTSLTSKALSRNPSEGKKPAVFVANFWTHLLASQISMQPFERMLIPRAYGMSSEVFFTMFQIAQYLEHALRNTGDQAQAMPSFEEHKQHISSFLSVSRENESEVREFSGSKGTGRPVMKRFASVCCFLLA